MPVDKHRQHADSAGPDDVRVVVVAHMRRLFGRNPESGAGELEDPRVRLAQADDSRGNDRVQESAEIEPLEQAFEALVPVRYDPQPQPARAQPFERGHYIIVRPPVSGVAELIVDPFRDALGLVFDTEPPAEQRVHPHPHL